MFINIKVLIRTLLNQFHVYCGEDCLIHDDTEFGKFVEIGDNVTIGKNVEIKSFVFIGDNVEIGDNVTIGRYCEIRENCVIGNGTSFGSRCTISANTIIEENCLIKYGFVVTDTPDLNDPTKKTVGTIHRNVKIGANVTLMPGCCIGSDSLVGAGCVVTKNIPPGVIWAAKGVAAKPWN